MIGLSGGVLIGQFDSGLDDDLAPTAGFIFDMFAELFGRLGPVRGVDYSIANRLCQMVADTGFSSLGLKVHQPAERAGASGLLLKWSVEEAGPAFVESGLITADQLKRALSQMSRAVEDPNVLAFAPRMSIVWGRKLIS